MPSAASRVNANKAVSPPDRPPSGLLSAPNTPTSSLRAAPMFYHPAVHREPPCLWQTDLQQMTVLPWRKFVHPPRTSRTPPFSALISVNLGTLSGLNISACRPEPHNPRRPITIAHQNPHPIRQLAFAAVGATTVQIACQHAALGAALAQETAMGGEHGCTSEPTLLGSLVQTRDFRAQQ